MTRRYALMDCFALCSPALAEAQLPSAQALAAALEVPTADIVDAEIVVPPSSAAQG
jgi:hypothetical protein